MVKRQITVTRMNILPCASYLVHTCTQAYLIKCLGPNNTTMHIYSFTGKTYRPAVIILIQ